MSGTALSCVVRIERRLLLQRPVYRTAFARARIGDAICTAWCLRDPASLFRDRGRASRAARITSFRASFDGFRLRNRSVLRVGLLVPFSGSDVIWGPSCQYSAVLAAAQMNENGGVLGREVKLFAVDAGGEPVDVVNRTRNLIAAEGLHVLIGVHLSSVRIALRQEFAGRIPYVFAPLYEGGENTPGVFAIGETPEQQFPGAIKWLIRERNVRRWFLIGNDYVWPRASHRAVKQFISDAGGEIVADRYFPLASKSYAQPINEIRAMRPDVVFQSLVGIDSVAFNRAFARAGLPASTMRLSGAIEENTLLGIGPDSTENLFSVSSYFKALNTPENKTFLHQYRLAFGERAPVQGVLSQSCYEAIRFFGTLANRAGSLDLGDLAASWEGLDYVGARGCSQVRGNWLRVPSHLAEAKGVQFHIVQSFPPS